MPTDGVFASYREGLYTPYDVTMSVRTMLISLMDWCDSVQKSGMMQ